MCMYIYTVINSMFEFTTWAMTYKDFDAVVKNLTNVSNGTLRAFQLEKPSFFQEPEVI